MKIAHIYYSVCLGQSALQFFQLQIQEGIFQDLDNILVLVSVTQNEEKETYEMSCFGDISLAVWVNCVVMNHIANGSVTTYA